LIFSAAPIFTVSPVFDAAPPLHYAADAAASFRRFAAAAEFFTPADFLRSRPPITIFH
jgi:hypothetical protein